MKLARIIPFIIIVPLLALDLYGMVRLIVDMINKITDIDVGSILVLFFMVFAAGMLTWALLPCLGVIPCLKEENRL